MSISNGQLANATNFNNAFISKTADDEKVGTLTLNKPANGASVNVQQAINTNTAAIAAHIADTADAHSASAITNVATGNLTSTDVQSALNELQTDIDSRLGSAVTGSRAAPTAVTAVGGVAFSGAVFFNLSFISGSGGAVTVTANPRIAAGTSVGQNLRLIIPTGANQITLADGNGLDLNGNFVGAAGSSLDLVWDGTNWFETARRSV